MKRQKPGEVNAYILNLMAHMDTQRLDEYEIRDRIERRFKHHRVKRIRPQNIRKFHIEPLIERRWLREVDGKYERVGTLKSVKPEWTLSDQFEGVPEEFVDQLIYDQEFNRNMFGFDDFESSLTEEEYEKYISETFEDSYNESIKQNRKLSEEETDTLYKALGIRRKSGNS